MSLKIVKVTPNQTDGVIVTLEKQTDQKTSLNERAFVNLKTVNNISFSKGFVALRHFIHKVPSSEPAKDEKFPPSKVQEVIAVLNEEAEKLKETYEKASEEEKESYKKHLVYVVEWNHLMASNISTTALGDETPQSYDWKLEVEPFSTFSYSLMRTNILDICIED